MTALPAQPPYLSEIVNRITHNFKPMQIILFGSWARGEARKDSDIDLLIILAKVSHKRKIAIQIGNALSDLPISKDILVATPEEISLYGKRAGNILRPALRDGKVIYESK